MTAQQRIRLLANKYRTHGFGTFAANARRDWLRHQRPIARYC
ncbi:hypothetical protein R6254_02850 [Polaromonas sp. SM01]|nr:hypothetical protein [Polaromonas sp. SM01]